MAATPTVVCRSAATCGNSESMTRTWAWLAKPATASKMIERVGYGRGGEMDGEESTDDYLRRFGKKDIDVDSQRSTGFLARAEAKRQ